MVIVMTTKKVLKAVGYFVIFCFYVKWYNEALDDAANAIFDLFRKEDQDGTATAA
jgi:hypothetical protein